MRRHIDPRLALVLAPFLAAPALADDLFVGGPRGLVFRADPADGDFQFAGVCGGPIRSMALLDRTIMIGDANGNMYGFDLDNGGVGYYFTLPGSDNTDIIVHDDTLLVSSLSGAIRRVNPANGQVLNTFNSPVQVQAMIRDDQFIYVAGPGGSVYRASLNEPEFSYFACVCLGPINSLAIINDEILAGDQWGTVMRFDLDNGEIAGIIGLPGDNTAMAVIDDRLFVTDSDGNVRRVNPLTGQVEATFVAGGLPIEAMVFVDGPACAGDFNADGQVDSADFFDYVTHFLALKHRADVNGDGRVASEDFFQFLAAFFTPCI